MALVNKLNRDCFIGHDTRILLYKYCEYTNIPSSSGKLVFDSSRLQEGIFVYTLVKLYNKANIIPGIRCMRVFGGLLGKCAIWCNTNMFK